MGAPAGNSLLRGIVGDCALNLGEKEAPKKLKVEFNLHSCKIFS